eukprot:TRINITY_DN10411_c0_g1_i2.p1 TRINITY_DN10411_c0_g1~~TRINITY_DN10411_c0_g1_i2.p1  ORF type:complete len:555 (-),score=44.88 TRINITY_DN10411_c0_g1_i2:211-1875(-)
MGEPSQLWHDDDQVWHAQQQRLAPGLTLAPLWLNLQEYLPPPACNVPRTSLLKTVVINNPEQDLVYPSNLRSIRPNSKSRTRELISLTGHDGETRGSDFTHNFAYLDVLLARCPPSKLGFLFPRMRARSSTSALCLNMPYPAVTSREHVTGVRQQIAALPDVPKQLTKKCEDRPSFMWWYGGEDGQSKWKYSWFWGTVQVEQRLQAYPNSMIFDEVSGEAQFGERGYYCEEEIIEMRRNRLTQPVWYWSGRDARWQKCWAPRRSTNAESSSNLNPDADIDLFEEVELLAEELNLGKEKVPVLRQQLALKWDPKESKDLAAESKRHFAEHPPPNPAHGDTNAALDTYFLPFDMLTKATTVTREVVFAWDSDQNKWLSGRVCANRNTFVRKRYQVYKEKLLCEWQDAGRLEDISSEDLAYGATSVPGTRYRWISRGLKVLTVKRREEAPSANLDLHEALLKVYLQHTPKEDNAVKTHLARREWELRQVLEMEQYAEKVVESKKKAGDNLTNRAVTVSIAKAILEGKTKWEREGMIAPPGFQIEVVRERIEDGSLWV